jgi:hypothetical protein
MSTTVPDTFSMLPDTFSMLQDISHKQLPEKLEDRRDIEIPYQVLVAAVAMALRLMKRIDHQVLGPSAKYLWREARKRRYDYISPPRIAYVLLPYLRLSAGDRIRVVADESAAGTEIWSEIPTTINGQPTTITACRKWGVIAIGDRLLALEQYPLQHLERIDFEPCTSAAESSNAVPIDSADGPN